MWAVHNAMSLPQSRSKESNAGGAHRYWVEGNRKKADNRFSTAWSLLFCVSITASHNTGSHECAQVSRLKRGKTTQKIHKDRNFEKSLIWRLSWRDRLAEYSLQIEIEKRGEPKNKSIWRGFSYIEVKSGNSARPPSLSELKTAYPKN